MSTFTITQDNAHSGNLADYRVIASSQFEKGDASVWAWRQNIRQSEEQDMLEFGDEGATLLVWEDGNIVSVMALGNAVID